MRKESNRNSKLVRVPNRILDKLQTIRVIEGSWGRAIEKLLTDASNVTFWALPSNLFTTQSQAKSQSLKIAAKKGASFDEREIPVPLKASNE